MPSAGGELLRESVTQQKKLLSVSSVLAAMHQGGEALVPVLIGVLIDRAVDGGTPITLLWWMVALAADFAMFSTAYRFSARIAQRAAQQAEHRMRMRITERVLDPRGGADSATLPGALVNIATGDARRVAMMQFAIPYGLFAALAGLLVSAISLLRWSIPLGLAVLLGAPLIVFGSRWLGKPLQRRSETEQQRAAHASGVATDLVTGLRVLKGIGAQDAAITRYRSTSRRSLAATLRAANAHAWHDAGILALTGIFVAAIALLGVLLAVDGELPIGGLIAAVGLAQYLFSPFQAFARLHGMLAQARGSATRIAAVLNAEPAVRGGDGTFTPPVRGELRLRGLSHGPLHEVDIEVAAGELLGVVAPTGACATALLECLGREQDPRAGSVSVDGVALSEIDPVAVREVVLIAAHDGELFAGTLATNVSAAANGSAVEPAMRAAAADEVADSLPSGLDTLVAERGSSLSGGQRQRIALARALAARPPVLVLHDPTTAVDTVTEARIAAAVRELRAGTTTVLVTSSPALLAETDRVVYLEDGRVRAAGTHADLLHDNENYRTAVLS